MTCQKDAVKRQIFTARFTRVGNDYLVVMDTLGVYKKERMTGGSIKETE